MKALAKAPVEQADDVCALSLARRMAALLDRDPGALRDGDPLPRGWHVMLFNPPTRQSELRADGAAHLGVTLPDLGLPRLMLGGRRVLFGGDIVIGAALRRESRQAPVKLKKGRTGRFAIVQVEHRIVAGDDDTPLLVETNDYVLREAAETSGAKLTPPPKAPDLSSASLVRVVTPDAAMLFRYSAITDNPHRIHYDLTYAREAERYPALLVNGSIPLMILLEMFRQHVGREPAGLDSKNLAPMFCGDALTLVLNAGEDGWAFQAHGSIGVALEGRVW